MASENNTIWTIGHSTHPFEVFIEMLHSFHIRVLVDVRSLPGSRKFPQFNKEMLEQTLPEKGIRYVHLLKLGGRRKVNPKSKNTAWRNASFRAYADYMETKDFEEGIGQLLNIADKEPTAYMCSEAVWWKCHRRMISDYLLLKSWKVIHISGVGKSTPHTIMNPAKVINGLLSYQE